MKYTYIFTTLEPLNWTLNVKFPKYRNMHNVGHKISLTILFILSVCALDTSPFNITLEYVQYRTKIGF